MLSTLTLGCEGYTFRKQQTSNSDHHRPLALAAIFDEMCTHERLSSADSCAQYVHFSIVFTLKMVVNDVMYNPSIVNI